MGGTRRGAAGVGRVVSLPERDLRTAEDGAADLVSVYLATFIQCTAFHCYRLHRAGGIRSLLLAATGNSLFVIRCRGAHSLGRKSSCELDRHAGNRSRSGCMFSRDTTALPAHHGDWKTVESAMGMRNGNDGLDYLR